MIYISIGSNVGDRLTQLRQAVALLKERYLKDLQASIVLETEAILPEGAPPHWNKPYLNMIVRGHCDLTPEALLAGLKNIELEMGRPPHYERWAPRLMDLDILWWDGVEIRTPTLKIPHPELKHRAFLQHLLATMMPSHEFAATEVTPCFINSFVIAPALVGVVNVTPDSFSQDGVSPERAIERAMEFAQGGAFMVDIGACSTRPQSPQRLTPEEEYARLEPVLDALEPFMKKKEINLSLDSYSETVVQRVLKQYSITWVNDVKGALSEHTLRAIAEKGCGFVAMHSLSIPHEPTQVIPKTQNVLEVLKQWGEVTKKKLFSLGFNEKTLILDPGIGFGQTAFQSLFVLKGVEALKTLGCPLLVGHSRKSFMSSFTPFPYSERDTETYAISDILKEKVDFLRVHDIKGHQRFFVAKTSVESSSHESTGT